MPKDSAQQLLLRQVTQNAPQGQVQAQFTASITGNILTVTALTQGVIQAGLQIAGAGIAPGLYVVGDAAANPGIPNVAVLQGGGGTPTGGSPGVSLQGGSSSIGVTLSGTLYGNPMPGTSNISLTGTGGLGTYLLSAFVGNIVSEAMTGTLAQTNTGPSVQVNQNPTNGNLVTAAGGATATAPINPGAVGYVVNAPPYSPGATYTANVQNNVSGVNTPAILLPANANEQVNTGNSVIGVAMRQGSMSDTGMVTGR